jgi:L-ribulose-5-phosphate 3-epimerase
MDRRTFLCSSVAAACLGGAGLRCTGPVGNLFKISLAEWSLNRSLFAGQVNHLDFPGIAKQNFGIDGVEYVNQFFMDKAEDRDYLGEMKKRCADLGVRSVLIMCDNEGRLGDPDEAARVQTVENHYKWVEAAKFLGCHSIRVNAYSEGSYEEQQKLVVDGLHRLAEFADQHQINVLIENHGGFSSNGKWLAGVMNKVAHVRVGTLPDFGNFQISADEWYDRYLGVEEMMPFAKAVSAKSSEFSQEGEEVRSDYLRLMRIVARSGYRGYVGIEYSGTQLSEMDGIAATKRLLERCRQKLVKEYPKFAEKESAAKAS